MPNRLSDAGVNLFCGSWQSIPAQKLTLIEALDAICTGRYQHAIEAVRAILQHEGKAAYDQAKAKLDAVTFGGTFSPRRGIAYLQQHSGIVHGDLDDLPDVATVKRAICSNPRTAYAFDSPSNQGLKVGVHVPVVADDRSYKAAWLAVSTAYQQYGGAWDPPGKDVSRLCFVSHDPALYWNPAAEQFDILPMPIPDPRATQRSVARRDYRYQGHAERAVRTAVDMIEHAELGTRHHTRLKVARLLGGYVAGGLLTEEQAYGALAQALVGHTEDLERALKTVIDGLRYGAAHPITFDELEVDRQAWIEEHFPVKVHSRTLAPGICSRRAEEVPAWR